MPNYLIEIRDSNEIVFQVDVNGVVLERDVDALGRTYMKAMGQLNPWNIQKINHILGPKSNDGEPGVMQLVSTMVH